MWQDFKDFIMQGNVLDMAIGVVMGSSFKEIVTALVDNVIMPIVTAVTGNADVSDLSFSIGNATLTYGVFIQAIIDFLIIALILFFIVRGVSGFTSRLKKEEEEAEEETPSAEEYLAEIRDLLREQNAEEVGTVNGKSTTESKKLNDEL